MTEKEEGISAVYKAKVAETASQKSHSTAELVQQPGVAVEARGDGGGVVLEGRGRKRPLSQPGNMLLAKIGWLQMRIDELKGQPPDVRG